MNDISYGDNNHSDATCAAVTREVTQPRKPATSERHTGDTRGERLTGDANRTVRGERLTGDANRETRA